MIIGSQTSIQYKQMGVGECFVFLWLINQLYQQVCVFYNICSLVYLLLSRVVIFNTVKRTSLQSLYAVYYLKMSPTIAFDNFHHKIQVSQITKVSLAEKPPFALISRGIQNNMTRVIPFTPKTCNNSVRFRSKSSAIDRRINLNGYKRIKQQHNCR